MEEAEFAATRTRIRRRSRKEASSDEVVDTGRGTGRQRGEPTRVRLRSATMAAPSQLVNAKPVGTASARSSAALGGSRYRSEQARLRRVCIATQRHEMGEATTSRSQQFVSGSGEPDGAKQVTSTSPRLAAEAVQRQSVPVGVCRGQRIASGHTEGTVPPPEGSRWSGAKQGGVERCTVNHRQVQSPAGCDRPDRSPAHQPARAGVVADGAPGKPPPSSENASSGSHA